MAMTLRLTDEDAQLLTELAELSGHSKHETVLRAIRQMHAQSTHEAAVASSSAKMRERYAELLDRLGN